MAELPIDPRAAEMVRAQVAARGVRDPRVLDAMARVPRGEFVPVAAREQAYEDRPVPIGAGQTISQPYMVGAMTELLGPWPRGRVLEVGTGSGYQAAVLALLAREVVSVERHAALARQAAGVLARLGLRNVAIHVGDGTLGWPPGAPYDAIIVTAGAPALPHSLAGQLADGGRLVCPVGDRETQELIVLDRRGDQWQETRQTRCVFVPLVGAEGWPEAGQTG